MQEDFAEFMSQAVVDVSYCLHTIAGGFDAVTNDGLSRGYLVDWDLPIMPSSLIALPNTITMTMPPGIWSLTSMASPPMEQEGIT